VGEKLNAFISFYSLKANEEVEKWTTKTAEDDVKWKKLTDELYPAALKTATGLNQLETFQQVFPSPGTYVENATKYGSLLGTDPDFAKQLKELYKWRNTKTQIANRKKYLAEAKTYVEKGGEDYINRLVKEISSKLVGTTLAVALFKSHPDYVEYIEELIYHVPGPDGVLTTPETYAALLEKRDGGAFPVVTSSDNATDVSGSKTDDVTERKSETTTEKKTDGSEKKVESSPINAGEKPKSATPSGESKPGESSAINTSTEKKNESTSVTSTEGQVTSKPGELAKEEPKTDGKVSTAINVNLETVGSSGSGTDGKGTVSTKPESSQTVNTKVDETKSPGAINAKVEEAKSPGAINTKVEEIKSPGSISSEKEKIESNTILNANNTVEKSEKILQTDKTAESTDVKSTMSSVNTENTKTQENSTNVEKTSSNTNEGAVNSPKEEKKKGGFLSKLGKISNAVGSALNLPTFKELGSQAAGLFGATGAKFMSNVSDISQSFSKNSINSNTTQKQETSDDTTANTSNSTTNTSVGDSQTTTMNLEKNSPTVSVENKTTTNLDQSNTSGGQVNSTSMSTVTASNPTSNQTILSPQAPANQPPSSNPQNMGSSPGTSVDLGGLAQSISRLEKILISGIEVTIKDT
jgi:hypothetical protein